MTPRLSRLMLTAHITFSLGWMGTIAAFLALALAGLVGNVSFALLMGWTIMRKLVMS